VGVLHLDDRLLGNGEACDECNQDGHYIVPFSTCSSSSIRVAMKCFEGYVLILHLTLHECIVKSCNGEGIAIAASKKKYMR
jgi:hypothetical protein